MASRTAEFNVQILETETVETVVESESDSDATVDMEFECKLSHDEWYRMMGHHRGGRICALTCQCRRTDLPTNSYHTTTRRSRTARTSRTTIKTHTKQTTISMVFAHKTR